MTSFAICHAAIFTVDPHDRVIPDGTISTRLMLMWSGRLAMWAICRATSRAHRRAVAAPKPDVAPVMNAVLLKVIS